MEKQYNHKNKESKIYRKWETSGAFKPRKASPRGKAFTIIMPPPNANDPLHIGHARFVAVEDTLTRFARLRGFSTLWLPGSDHAGIETQFVFEKRLREKGQSRFDFDRDTLFKMIWKYVEENTGVMQEQMKALGASVDWSRHKFTLDPDIQKIVYKTFNKLHKDKLLYRDRALVNYCTHCGTAFSNLEVNHIERVDPLYYMKYGPFVLATVRPETKFGDTAIAVNPKDKRYKKWIGKEVEVVGLNGKFKITVIADSAVDPLFGTGVVKVTPAHDHNDFQIAKRHNLEMRQIIDFDGKLNSHAGKYEGLYIKQARRAVVEGLEKAGLMVKIDKNYKHNISVCYRCKNVIEPLPLEQWFIKMEPLAKKALSSIKSGDVKFAVKRFEKQAKHWLNNLQDWNISRQIVWGMRIPAFKCDKCLEWHITEGKVPKKCKCGSTKFTQDTDTFDTWFSSGQWPFATLKTNKKQDFEKFYPTDVMNTGYDIILFWVIRMIMLGLYATGKVPFKNVVIHGLVRDKNGFKISKSKGNVIDPMEMVEKYGADALRMGLLWGALVENDISLSEENIRGQRNFGNKLWNIARFVTLDNHTGDNTRHPELVSGSKSKRFRNKFGMTNVKNQNDKRILIKLDKATKLITKKIEEYKLSEALEILYDFVWNDFASDYLESVKNRKTEALPILNHVLKNVLIVSHPFMPFVTEAIWSEAKYNKKSMLISAAWPTSKAN